MSITRDKTTAAVNDWIKTSEARDMLGVKPRAMQTIIQDRQLTVRRMPGSRILISRASVEALLQRAVEPAMVGA